MDHQKNELIEAEADEERKPRGDCRMSHMLPFRCPPPLHNDEQDHDRNPETGHCCREQIEK